MPEPEGDEEARHAVEHQTPGVLDVASDYLEIACQHHQQTLADNSGDTVESATDAHEVSLLMLFKTEHIKAVGSNVVGCTGEGHQPEESQRPLQPVWARYGEGHTAQCSTDEQLHGDNPPALSLDDVYERAPQGFDDPRQIEPGCVERDVGIRQAETLVHDE